MANYVFPGQAPVSYPTGPVNQTYTTNQSPYMQVIPMSTKEGAEQYPLAANTTAVFMNYNARKLWIKTEHPNGLSYDMEEFTMFNNQELQNFQTQIQQSVTNSTIQNGNGISKEEYASDMKNILDRLTKLEEIMK